MTQTTKSNAAPNAILESYAQQFGNAKFIIPDSAAITKVGRRYFLATEDAISKGKESGQDIFSTGMLLGEEKQGSFSPGVGLLDIIGKPENLITINDDAEWLFLCGRDVFEKNITEIKSLDKASRSGLFIVQNSLGEKLGIGQFVTRRNETFLKNILDRGNFLRREH
jgi:ribosome biogenesis protein Nip4